MQSGSHEFLAQDRVTWGVPAAQAAVAEADRRGAKRVFVVTSRTLNRRTDAVARRCGAAHSTPGTDRTLSSAVLGIG